MFFSRPKALRYSGVLCATATVAILTAFASPAAAQSSQEPAAFACESGFYQVISGQLARLDPGTGSYELIGDPSSGYNAIGYRNTDGFLYGIRGTELLRIDAAGTVTTVMTLPFEGGSYAGDFGDDGLLHVSRGGRDWHAIDVDTGQSTPIPALSGNYGVADITNVYGLFYGVSSSGDLIRFDPVAQTVTTVGAVSGLPASSMSYGAAWSSAGGNLYVGRNSGELFQVTGYSGSSPTATQVASTAATNSNDGASCSLAPAPEGIADVDGAEPETAPSTPEAQAAAEANEEREETTYTFPDAGIPDGPSCTNGIDEDRPPRSTFNAQAVSSPTTIYTSGNSVNLADFEVLSGLWSVDGNSLDQSHTCGYDYTVLLRAQPLEHYVWEATVHGRDGVNQAGVLINQSSPLTRSGATLIDLAEGGSVLRWGAYDNLGYYQMIGSVPLETTNPDGGVTFAVEVHGADVQLVVSGVEIATFTADNGGGLVGLVSSRAAASFENVSLTALSAVIAS